MGICHKINGLLLAIVAGCFFEMPLSAATAKFGVQLIDADTLAPIEGAKVVGYFENNNGWKAWTEAAPEYTDEQRTDKEGLCWLKGETNNGDVGFHVRNPPVGYYPNNGIGYQFAQKPLLPLMHWRPTDLVITAVLCKVERPIPLFVKRATFLPGVDEIARNGDKVLYDLIKGDCLPPFGKGEVPDIEFTVLPQEAMEAGKNVFYTQERKKNIVRMSFVGDIDNGLVVTRPRGDAYLRVRSAPLSGYGKDFLFSEWYAYNLEQKEGHDQSRCFSFRIRVKRNLQGEIESAIYGKIYGDARFLYRGDDYAADRWSRKVDGLSFLYYLNPTPNDRNLEWDRKNNLCDQPGNLKLDTSYILSVLP